MTTYTARATRSGDWWAIEVEELEGVFTQARRLEQVEAMARDAIALMLDIPPDSFDIVMQPELPVEWRTDLDQMWRMRQAADLVTSMAMIKTIQTVRALRDDAGLPLRDIGRVLGISFQRVHQLLSSPLRTNTDAFSEFVECVDTDRLEKAKTELGIQ